MVDRYFSTILRQVYDQVNKLIKVSVQSGSLTIDNSELDVNVTNTNLAVRTAGVHGADTYQGQTPVVDSSTTICAEEPNLSEGTILFNMETDPDMIVYVRAENSGTATTSDFPLVAGMSLMIPTSKEIVGISDYSGGVDVGYIRI